MKEYNSVDDLMKDLRKQSWNDESLVEGAMGSFTKHFGVVCKKCGSINIFVSWEDGIDYGEYTGYCEGQKLFKCNDCGNAYSFWS